MSLNPIFDYAAAVIDYEAALRLDPNHAETLMILAGYRLRVQ